MNPSGGDDVHFIQMWVSPDTVSAKPGYQHLDINAELDRGARRPRSDVVSPRSPHVERNSADWAGCFDVRSCPRSIR